jgi:hypothetical protein
VNTVDKKVITTIDDQWTTFLELYRVLHMQFDPPTVLKSLHNLTSRGVLERYETGDRVFYRVAEPPPSEEKTGEQLIEEVLEYRIENNLIRGEDMSRMRRKLEELLR